VHTACPSHPAALFLLFAGLLAGCAATGGSESDSHITGTGGNDSQQGTKEMQPTCDMHRQHMAGRTPQEEQAIAARHA
jgi:hypothetical protein